MACLRFGFVFFICLLFFFPLVKIKRERIEKPRCFLLLDQSSSMRGAADTALLEPIRMVFGYHILCILKSSPYIFLRILI